MTDQERKAMEMALEALENNQPVNYCQNNNGERFPMFKEDPFRFDCNTKAIEALRQALNVDAIDTSSTYVDENEKREHEPVAYACKDDVILAKHWTSDEPPSGWVSLYTAPLSKQEPVLWKWSGDGWSYEKPMFPATPLYAAPPSKPWVDLPLNEVNQAADREEQSYGFVQGALWAEAALKEKNNG